MSILNTDQQPTYRGHVFYFYPFGRCYEIQNPVEGCCATYVYFVICYFVNECETRNIASYFNEETYM